MAKAPFSPVVKALMRLRTDPVNREEDLCRIVESTLLAAGFRFRSQVNLGPGARIDFLVAPGTGIEVKAGRPPTLSTTKQLEHYAVSDQVQELVLVTEAGIPGLPAYLNGKPAHQIALRSLWGIAS
jgi:hypothetical protein